ncbi:hypothetical protein [Enterococcus casseliflavus]|uniref:hypothetical protein n=1 Tax=Enterococcus casseliflavus TaxID=37734 RepID=UPI002DBF180C|nr:hypothetical protein [Enterococcus casseliflavus]MEB6147644.1 hypothetical protein [Enterococcus casseliflavus]
MEITLSELLQSNLIKPSTKDSIIKVGKMRDNVKKSVIAQLGHRFETVEYVAGKRGQEPRFILEKPKEVESEYIPNVGRPSIDWSEIDNYIENRMAMFMVTATDENGQSINHYVTKRRLVKYLIRDKKVMDVIRRLYIRDKTLHSFHEIKSMYTERNWVLDKTIYDLTRVQDDIDYVINNVIVNCLLARVDAVLAKHSHDVKYKSKNSENEYQEITVETYNQYREFVKSEKELNKRITKKQLAKKAQEKFKFEFAFATYFVYEAQELANDNFDITNIKKFLINRGIESAKRKQAKFEITDVKDDDILSIRLLKNSEFVEFMKLFYQEFFNDQSFETQAEKDFLKEISDYQETLNVKAELNGGKLDKVDKRKIIQINIIKNVA